MKKFNIILALVVAMMAMGVTSCKENPYKYEIAKGHPEVFYARMSAPADSLITSAFMGNFICLVGDNLKSTVKIAFNDQDAYINTSLVTENTLLVQVPNVIPVEVSNMIYLTGEDNTVVEFPFNVLVPGPVIVSMSNEFAAPGMKTTVYGDYFLDASIDPFYITLPDGTTLGADDVELSKGAITFTVPENYTGEMGNINVHTVYGNATSPFLFHDTRCIILDFDGGAQGGAASFYGWRTGIQRCSDDEKAAIPALNGNFCVLGGNGKVMSSAGDWADDPFELDVWYKEGSNDLTVDVPALATMLADYTIDELAVKFEIYVPSSNPWSAGGFQVIWMGKNTDTNAPHSTNTYPRGIYNPWAAIGSYGPSEWQTVTMPLADFKYGPQGADAGAKVDATFFNGLSIFVFQGGIEGTECTPIIAFDNFRVVPN